MDLIVPYETTSTDQNGVKTKSIYFLIVYANSSKSVEFSLTDSNIISVIFFIYSLHKQQIFY